jgi:hypothetical protein
MIRQWSLSLAILLSFAGAVCAAPKGDELFAAIKLRYEETEKAIEQEYADYKANCIAACRKNLQTLQTNYQKKGNLEAVMAVRSEIERFNKDKTIPRDQPEDLLPAIKNIRQAYVTRTAKAVQQRNRKTKRLHEQQVKRLEKLKTDLVRKGDIDTALKVKEEIEKVSFVLADFISKMPEQSSGPGSFVSRRNAVSTVRVSIAEPHLYRVDKVKEDVLLHDNRQYKFTAVDGKLRNNDFLVLPHKRFQPYVIKVTDSGRLWILTFPGDRTESIEGWTRTDLKIGINLSPNKMYVLTREVRKGERLSIPGEPHVTPILVARDIKIEGN